MHDFDIPFFNMFLKPVVALVNVFHRALMFGVFGYLDGRHIVNIEEGGFTGVGADLVEEFTHPYDFGCGGSGSHILCLCQCRQHLLLQSATPEDGTTTN